MSGCKCRAFGAVWEVNVHKSKVNEIAFFNVQPNTPRIHECTLKTKHWGIIQYMRQMFSVHTVDWWVENVFRDEMSLSTVNTVTTDYGLRGSLNTHALKENP